VITQTDQALAVLLKMKLIGIAAIANGLDPPNWPRSQVPWAPAVNQARVSRPVLPQAPSWEFSAPADCQVTRTPGAPFAGRRQRSSQAAAVTVEPSPPYQRGPSCPAVDPQPAHPTNPAQLTKKTTMLTNIRTIIAFFSAAMATGLVIAPFAVGGTAQASPTRAATAPPACTAADLGVWVAADQSDGTLGTIYYPLEFTNLSKQTCALYGHPGVSAIDAHGRQLGSPASWGDGTATTVQLAPAATAYAALGYNDVITGNCPKASKRTPYELQIYPPGQTQADHTFWDLPACTAPGSSAFMTVQVIAPGPGVRGDDG
jgi:hypothetical protein